MAKFPKIIKRILVTGGSGFIGTNLITKLLTETKCDIFNLDKVELSNNIKNFNDHDRYHFLQIDINNYEACQKGLKLSNPDIVFHLAAESHVDKSISGPRVFIESNVVGTFNLLESSMLHWKALSSHRGEFFRFIHVSTDEVFGSLGPKGLFSEKSSYDPSSPYSASKAASDHLAKAWFQTYGFPSIVTNSSNNFGPWQLPEKLIPVIITKAINKQPIPIYGDGKNVRDWIYVEDHIDALIEIALHGRIGDSYCIGGNQEKNNEEILELICNFLDQYKKINAPHHRFKVYVKDRLGHDRRYAIDNTKLRNELKWSPKHNFSTAISSTVKWYLNNIDWCQNYFI